LFPSVLSAGSSLQGAFAEIKQQVIETSLNGSGVRDTARVLPISPTTVIHELKKRAALTSVNTLLLSTLHPSDVAVSIDRIDDAEVEVVLSKSCWQAGTVL